MWKRSSPFGSGFPPGSVQEQWIQHHHVWFVWDGKRRPDPSQLPDGFEQSPADRGRGQRAEEPEERLVRRAFALLGLGLALLVAGSL